VNCFAFLPSLSAPEHSFRLSLASQRERSLWSSNPDSGTANEQLCRFPYQLLAPLPLHLAPSLFFPQRFSLSTFKEDQRHSSACTEDTYKLAILNCVWSAIHTLNKISFTVQTNQSDRVSEESISQTTDSGSRQQLDGLTSQLLQLMIGRYMGCLIMSSNPSGLRYRSLASQVRQAFTTGCPYIKSRTLKNLFT
jgi:hypothetical protein